MTDATEAAYKPFVGKASGWGHVEPAALVDAIAGRAFDRKGK